MLIANAQRGDSLSHTYTLATLKIGESGVITQILSMKPNKNGSRSSES